MENRSLKENNIKLDFNLMQEKHIEVPITQDLSLKSIPSKNINSNKMIISNSTKSDKHVTKIDYGFRAD